MSEGSKDGISHALHVRNKKRYSGSFIVLVAVVVMVVGFVAGTRSDQLLATIAPNLGLSINTGTIDDSSLQETYRVLSSKFAGNLDNDKLIAGMNRGMVDAAGDQFTKYFTAEEAVEYNAGLSGNIGGGIGAEMAKRQDKIVIVRVLPQTPAEKSGLKAGDQIFSVNDTTTEGKSLTDVVELIRGEVDTTVKLIVVRSGETKTFSIKREQITAPDVETKTEKNIGIIRVSRFDKETGVHIRAAAEDLKKQEVKGVVLDLRGNGGGYLTAAVDTAGVWLDNKVVVSERRNGKVQDELKSASQTVLQNTPTVVLIDSNTASASEIVAGALHDYGMATLVGEKSFGKGSVQTLVGLSNGAELKVTVAKWYTPHGNNINGQGITPDVKVELSADEINAGKDPQLNAALKKLGA